MPSRVRPPKRDPKPVRPPKPDPTPEPTPAPETEAAPGGGAVTMGTPIRDIGDVSEAAARRFLAGSPLEPHAAAIVKAAKGWSAMALAFAKKESSLGTGASARQTNNPLGLMRRTGDTRRCLQLAGGCLLHFPTWADAFAEYATRIGSAPYDPSKSLKHNTLVFVGGPRCPDILAADPNGVCANGHKWDAGNPDTDLSVYLAQTVDRINAVKGFDAGPVPKPMPPPNAAPTFGKVPHPPFLDRPIFKPEGQGWNDLGPRSPKGVVLHRMIGSLWGTDGYFRQAGVNALTDYGVGVSAKDGAAKDGETIRWNDPVGRRAGWASGPVSAPYGDGAAFVAKYGANAVNRDLVSIEISGDYPTPLSPRAFEAICGVTAYWADRARVPWSSFPLNPATGISFVYWHQEFTLGTGKICPGPVVIEATTRVIERARAILRTHQTGGVGPAPTPSPVPPKETLLSRVRLPEGVTVADLREWFGKGLDEDGPVSVAWAEEAARTGQYPELVRFDPPGEQRDFRFASGLVVRYEDGEARVLRLTSGLAS